MDAYTFAPVDLGAPLGGDVPDKYCLDITAAYGWQTSSVGSLRMDDWEIGFVRTGFAVLIHHWISDGDMVEYCRKREKLHAGLCASKATALPSGFSEMIARIRRHLAHAKPDRARTTDGMLIHYAFTMLSFQHEPNSRDLYISLDPSLIGFGDDGSGKLDMKALHSDLTIGRPIIDMTNRETRKAFALRTRFISKAQAIASWAGLVLIGADKALIEKTIRLEVGIQAAWLAAWLAQGMSERVLDMKENSIRSNRIAWECLEYQGMEYWGTRHGSPDESQSDVSLRHSLEITSGLREEWNLAMIAIGRAQQLAELIESKRRGIQSALLDILLLALSLTSLVQVLYAMPLNSWQPIWTQIPQSISLFILGVAGVWLIIRNRL